MKVSKEFTFHAAHKDDSAPVGDQCAELHGHTYRLRFEVEGPQDGRGMVLHGNVLKDAYVSLIEPLVEHKYLNKTLPMNPTMEAVAEWCGTQLIDHLNACLSEDITDDYSVEVELWETPTMSARWP